jgi:hypothetical protein
MNLKHIVFGLAAMAASLCAQNLGSGTITMVGTEPTTTVRLTQNGVASVFGTQKPFPGTQACEGGTCFFQVVVITPGSLELVQVDLTGSANVFASGYLNSFSTADLSHGYLGDPGVSGSTSFQVKVPSGNILILAFNSIGNTFGSLSYSVTGTQDFGQTNFDQDLLLKFFFN